MKITQMNLNTLSHIVVDIKSITVGEYIFFDIYIKKDNNYFIIIEAGTLITESLFQKLQKQSKLYIAKEDVNRKQLNCQNLHLFVSKIHDDIPKCLEFIYKMNDKVFADYLNDAENKIDLKCVGHLIESLIYLISLKKEYLREMIPHLINKHDLSAHSLHVALYCIKLGLAYKLDSKQLLQLGIAAMLHDLGLKKIDHTILHKESALDIKELELIHKHTLYSVDIVKHNGIHDPYIIDAILHHHENYDQSGYPNRLGEKEISEFASIIAIADVFDALTSTRPQRQAFRSFDALKMMMQDQEMSERFNHEFLQLFLKSI